MHSKSKACAWKQQHKKVNCPAIRHEGAWGERRYSSYSVLTSALDRGEWSASRPGRALPPDKGPQVPIVEEIGEPQSRSGRKGWKKNPLLLSGIEHRSSSP
jgi:hypothetical protein